MTALREALAGPLAPLAALPRFLIYKVVPDPKRPGKTNKFPVDPATGAYVDAATQGLTCEQALAALPDDGEHGVGFYFDEADGFWFLDVDGAWSPDEGWSPLVGRLDALLPGAAREVSHSGTGLHYFGRGPVPEHRCRDVKGDGLELYSGRRFVALTGAHISGSADAQPLEGLAQLVAEWFPPLATGSGGHDGGGPREDWSGPDDDDELIALIESSTHRVPAFGDSGPAATDAELWRGDAQVLAELYPETDPSKGRPFDASTAGWALARALGYWTGCDLERMERLLWRSPFMGVSGWDAGKAYRTLRKRVAEWPADRKVLQRGTVVKAQLPGPGAEPAPERPPRGSLLDGPGMADLFRGCVYVKSEHAVLTPGGEMLPPGPFNVEFGGYSFLMKESTEGAGAIKSEAFQAFTQSARFECARVAVSIFDPRLPFAAVTERHGLRAVNVYRPLPGARAAGDPSVFLDHLELMLPVEEDRRILLSWMAACVQHPGVKFQWWPIIQGCEGNGKTLLADIVAFCIGETYATQVRVKDLTNNFNAWMRGALFVLIDDIGPRGLTGETLDLVKPMVTRRSYPIERKGHDTVVEDVFFNGMGTTNYKDAVPIEEGTRRFAPFFTAQQSREHLRRDGMTPAYLDRLWRWLNEDGGMAVVHDYLASYAIPDELNPAKGCVHAPPTSSVLEAIEASKDTAADTLDELLGSGQPGLRGGWVNANALRAALGRDMPTVASLTDQLARRGYIPHPALAANRGLTRDPLADGKKGRLYIARGHRTESWTSGVEVAKAYEADQVPGGFGDKPDHVAAVK